MPKVSSHEVRIKGSRTKLDIYYSKKDSFSVPKGLEDVSTATGARFSGYETEGALINTIDVAITLYHNMMRTKKKVILYRIASTSEIIHEKELNGYYTKKEWASKVVQLKGDFFTFTGYALGLEYKVAWRVDRNGVKYFNLRTGNESWLEKEILERDNSDQEMGSQMGSVSDMIEIDWTEEREKALEEICKALAAMAEKVCRVLADPEKTISLLDSGQKLLPR